MKLPGSVVLAGAVIAGIGTVLPWAVADTEFGTISRAGVQGDGIFVLVLAAVAGVLGAVMLARGPSRGLRIGSLLAIALGLLVLVYDWINSSPGTTIEIQTGPGVYVTLVGGLIAAVGALLPATSRQPAGL